MSTESEVELCTRIRDWAERLGFEVYPEVDGWDLVLVVRGAQAKHLASDPWGAKKPVEPGQQVGIHAKLRANCDVLLQAAPPRGQLVPGWRYPHLPFVAVPSPGESFVGIAGRLGIGVIDTTERRARRAGWGGRIQDQVAEPEVRDWPTHDHAGREMGPLLLPPIASRCIVAGAPSPRSLSPWRVGALRFLALARKQETFTIADMARFGISRSWADRWGSRIASRPEVRRGRTVSIGVYRLVDRAEALPDWGYRDVAEELLAADERSDPPAAASP